jgi:mono/diheme cytochrome c family protein
MRAGPAVLSLALTALATAATARTADIARGEAFVASHCATCHAIGREGASPYAAAPPFRTLHERYDVSSIAEALAEGIVVGHTGERQMPQFALGPDEIDDVIAYLKSLEGPAAKSR